MRKGDRYLVVAWGTVENGASAASLAIVGSLAGQVSPDVTVRCCQRIGPELVADMADAEHVIFVDAHRRADWPDLVVEEVKPASGYTPEGECDSPAELIAMLRTLYHHRPNAWLVATRIVGTGTEARLSRRGLKMVDAARRIVLSMLPKTEPRHVPRLSLAPQWPAASLN